MQDIIMQNRSIVHQIVNHPSTLKTVRKYPPTM
jgi:hypothetical protein